MRIELDKVVTLPTEERERAFHLCHCGRAHDCCREVIEHGESSSLSLQAIWTGDEITTTLLLFE